MQNLLEIFTETQIQGVKARSKVAWQYETPRRHPFANAHKYIPGRTLKDLALRSALGSLTSFTPESLQGVPWHLIEELWMIIMKLGLNSFNNWRNFATQYGDIIEEGLRFHVSEIPRPYQSLSHYLSGAFPQSSEWITFVTICNLQVCAVDIALLGKFPSLGVLEFVKHTITQPEEVDGGFEPDDGILRSWSRAARAEGAFARLRTLTMRNQFQVTGASLPWLSAFPALYTFVISASGVTSKHLGDARKAGWQVISRRSGMQERYPRSGLAMGVGLAYQRNQYIGAGMLRRDIDPKLEPDILAEDGKPVHMFRIGYGADSVRDRSSLNTSRDIIFERIAVSVEPSESSGCSQSSQLQHGKRLLSSNSSQPEQVKRPKIDTSRGPALRESRKQDVGELLSFIDGSTTR